MYESAEHNLIIDELQMKIKTLHDSVWERKGDWPQVLDWLRQFKKDVDPNADEQLQVLRLLSNFMYFGVNEIRGLLRSLFRDSFRPQIAKEIRLSSDSPLTLSKISEKVHEGISKTRFVSFGNSSSSSAFLLYYFRQENTLCEEKFINSSDILNSSKDGSGKHKYIGVQDPNITRYVFIDDLCGSGKQAQTYSEKIIKPLKKLNPDAKAYYYPLFGLTNGIKYLRQYSYFDQVHPVVELDSTFRAFAEDSRLYVDSKITSLRLPTETTCRRYGKKLFSGHPLGWEDGQLYIGFAHNTPNNSLPIFWSAAKTWQPIFRRYPKF